MRALVVYESQYGNVERIAQAIAEELGVTALPVDAGGPAIPAGTDLLVVGGPTHALTMSTAVTRAAARGSGGRGSAGIRDWIAAASLDRTGAVAVFGTQTSRVSGSAAKAAGRHVRKRGAHVVATGEFLVQAQAGPLVDGEVERARAWARTLSA